MAFGMQEATGDVALTLTTQGAATVTSGPIAGAGAAAYVLVMVHVSAVTGTPTLNTSLEESSDNSSWTAVTGSATAQLAAAGNAVAFAKPTKNYVRVTCTVAGTSPVVTGTVAVLAFAE
jgi:hypothetical protein